MKTPAGTTDPNSGAVAPNSGAVAETSKQRQRIASRRRRNTPARIGPVSPRPAIISFLFVVLLGGIGGSAVWYFRPAVHSDDVMKTVNTDAETNGSGDLTFSLQSDQMLNRALENAGRPLLATTMATARNTPTAGRADSSTQKQRQQEDAERQQWITEKAIPFLVKYCTDCHGSDEQNAGIALHDLRTPDQFRKDRKTWERVYRMINAGAMPPAGHDPFPPEAEMQEIAEVLYDALFNFDCSTIDHPGRPTAQRLNRAEYNNTIRDLFGISITPADAFPQDDVGEGFDNVGDVLSLPPLLMEKYLDAAEEVAFTVIDTRDFSKPFTKSIRGPELKSSLGTSADGSGFVMLQTTGNVSAETDISVAGRYSIRIEARADQAGDDPAKIGLLIDGNMVKEFETHRRGRPDWYQHDMEISAGRHAIAAAFLNDFYNPDAKDGRRDRNLLVRTIEITGPEGGSDPAWHETHQRFVTARPDENTSVRQAAAKVLRPILYRAFRRPVTDTEVDRFASLVEQQVNSFHETYDYGLAVGLQAILVSPDFLFRIEPDPPESEQQRILTPYEAASRLSYFLWSSTPDEELLRLADNARLLDSTILSQQIRRLLKDDRSESLGRNFAAQWLNLRNLKDVRPNPDVFPDFDDTLRTAMARETELFFNTVVREDRSVDDFLLADFTFVNERLAKHYAMPGITGDAFVRVALTGTNRSGVLTQGSILTLTSNPGRTSPVKRGKWIMENILGQAPPPPPPAVPELEATAKAAPELSLREQLALHRQDPGCASCHKMMDPLGLGLENFDAVGRWRERDGDKAIDASGELPSGESFNGSLELMGILKARREQFHRALVERMMVYALGRGLDYYDKCAVDKILERMKQQGFRFSVMVEGIVMSDPFLKRSRLRDPEVTATQ